MEVFFTTESSLDKAAARAIVPDHKLPEDGDAHVEAAHVKPEGGLRVGQVHLLHLDRSAATVSSERHLGREQQTLISIVTVSSERHLGRG